MTASEINERGDRMKNRKDPRADLSLNVIGGLVGLMLLFGLLVCVIGNACLVDAFKNEYSTATYHMADAAAVFVNGDHIDDYLAGKETEEYTKTRRELELMCHKLNVSLIYVIKVDTSDYGRFISVFNAVDNTVDNSTYTPWELGYERDTTNDEYREKYRNLYEQTSDCETIFRMDPSKGAHPHITTLVPIEDRRGSVTAILCFQRPISEMEGAFRPYFLSILAGVAIMLVIISLLAGLFLRKSIIKPISKVSAEAKRFARENAKGEPLGALSRYDVIRDLSLSIDSMETDMVSYIDNLTAVTAEKERIGAELSIASTIQADSLPDIFPPFPNRDEFDIYASMDPAKEIGGDFYNFLLIDDDHLAIIMADVSGKGVPAALFMMASNILISNRAQMGGTPAEILRFVNDNICDYNRAEMFVTVWLGILEISTGKLIASSAGHEYPAIYRGGGRFELFKDKHGFVVGGMKGVKYKDYELTLNKGDKLFLYTDGLPEATNSSEEMFSAERMIASLNEHRDGSPKEILEGVRRDVDRFVGDAPQFDDLTMLCIEIK